jgi:RNA polymerase sigma-70 factor (ECF subfamily)
VRALLEQHVPHVYRFALRLAGDPHRAEDLTQETFLRAWRARKRLRDPEAARVWLLRIAVNLWRDQARRARCVVGRPAPLADDHAGRQRPPDRGAVDRENLQRALAAMDALPERQREVLHLRACEGLSIGQIADVLGIRPDAAKASLSLARKTMRRQLRDLCRDRFPTA